MDERYPIGETDSVAVAVLRHERREAGYPMWSTAITTRGGEATVHVPGHYAGVLATRLRRANELFAAGAKLPAGRDEFLELTALVREEGETIALSSTARSPVRVTVEVLRGDVEGLAGLLDHAQSLIDELKQGLGLVPDSLPDGV